LPRRDRQDAENRESRQASSEEKWRKGKARGRRITSAHTREAVRDAVKPAVPMAEVIDVVFDRSGGEWTCEENSRRLHSLGRARPVIGFMGGSGCPHTNSRC